MPSIIIGTAGHIDHGKSALVRALTGTDPDRLPEEKKRGITIDLGFADLELDDMRLGFVDVPGHERFVKNMLAGAHGIDVLALVIAADEGVMPQTREHFDICRLLGVKQGVVVITKSDLVEDNMLSLVEEEARELVAASFLEGAPVIAVSSKSGQGLEELRSIFKDFARKSPARSSDSITRLPIDRAFSIKGFGAVVTGTLIAGEISEGSELELLPKEVDVRVRGIQVHGKSVTHAEAGQRTAVNLVGIDVSQLQRGMLLTEQSALRSTQIIDVQIDVLPHASRGLKSRSRIRLHIGTAEVLGRVQILDPTSEAAPGESAFAQLRLELPIVAVNGDRFIIRSYSPAETVAGGIVLDPFAPKHRGKEIDKTLEKLARLKTSPVEKLASLVESSEVHGLKIDDIVAATGWKREVVAKVIEQAQSQDDVVETNGVLLSSESFAQLSADVLDELENYHKREPLARGMLRETLREKVFSYSSVDFFNGVIAKVEASGKLVAEKDIVRAATHSVGLSEKEIRLRESLEQTYVTAGVEAPSLEEAMKRVGLSAQEFAQARKVLQLLIDDHTLVRIQNDLFMHKDVVENLRSKLLHYGAQHEPERLIDVAAFKDLAGVSRKYAIPLLEYFDRERVTRRAGDKRLILPV